MAAPRPRSPKSRYNAAACTPLALSKQQPGFTAELLLRRRRGGDEVDPPAWCTQQPCALETRKELEVLVLLAAGLRNKEIAARLSRSARTADHHLESVFAKLGVATRAEAVGAAYRLGLVAADGG